MSNLRDETVLSVHHWDERVFSFTTTRAPGLRFDNGQFVMLGLEVGGRPLLRAYSVVSPNHEDFLEFLSIKVPDGPLTSCLQHIKPGDRVLVGTKPTGTLLVEDLKPGRNLFLLATGTGLAPFMSIVRDPATYERFDQVVLTHGVRVASELAYRDHILRELPRHEFLGEFVRGKLRYYPTVTREHFEHVGRLTDLLGSGRLLTELGLPPLDPALDRAMICGSPAMLKDLSALLDAAGFRISPGIGEAGDYVVEKAFAVR
jgi:ferredoxin--NADP+ reductase